MKSPLHIDVVRGHDVHARLDAVARLRIAVFADWPYLYDGDVAYERDYLQAYARSPDSVFVLAMDGDEVVGASTGLPLADDAPAFSQPFRDVGVDIEQVFYFGESVLLPQYRGKGIGHAFFDARERHARALHRFGLTAFCSVDRPLDDARRPTGHRENAAFWEARGYRRQPGLTMRLAWNERDRGQVEHDLTFWTRALEASP